MATLVRAPSWGQVKPPDGTPIDWGHPLAQDLGGLWLPADSAPYFIDATGRTLVRIASGDTTSTRTPLGITTTGSTGVGFKAVVTNLSQLKGSSVGLSIWWRGVVLGTGTASCPVFNLFFSSGAGAPFDVWGFDRGTGAAFRFAYNSGGGFISTTEFTPISNRVVDYVVTWKFGTSINLYENGVVHDTVTTNVIAPTTTSTDELWFNGYGANNRGMNGTTIAAAMWNRPLTFSEVKQLATNPYGMFAPPGPQSLYVGIQKFITTAQALTATQTQTPSMVRSVGKVLSLTQTQTPSRVLQVGKNVTATQTQTPSFGPKQVAHAVTATQTQTPSITKQIVLKAWTVTQTQTASMVAALAVIAKGLIGLVAPSFLKGQDTPTQTHVAGNVTPTQKAGRTTPAQQRGQVSPTEKQGKG